MSLKKQNLLQLNGGGFSKMEGCTLPENNGTAGNYKTTVRRT